MVAQFADIYRDISREAFPREKYRAHLLQRKGIFAESLLVASAIDLSQNAKRTQVRVHPFRVSHSRVALFERVRSAKNNILNAKNLFQWLQCGKRTSKYLFRILLSLKKRANRENICVNKNEIDNKRIFENVIFWKQSRVSSKFLVHKLWHQLTSTNI